MPHFYMGCPIRHLTILCCLKKKKYHSTVFATRYEPDTNVTTVKKDLESNLLRAIGVRHIVTIEKIATRYDHYGSFKISCSCDNTAVFTNPEVWPTGILVRWWRQTR
ncbi:unnamed protein product, partial [Meganyctiphanes norvegica]